MRTMGRICICRCLSISPSTKLDITMEIEGSALTVSETPTRYKQQSLRQIFPRPKNLSPYNKAMIEASSANTG